MSADIPERLAAAFEGTYALESQLGQGTDTLTVAHLQREPAFLVTSTEFPLDAPTVEGPEAEPEEPHYWVVVNWFEELKAKLGEGN